MRLLAAALAAALPAAASAQSGRSAAIQAPAAGVTVSPLPALDAPIGSAASALGPSAIAPTALPAIQPRSFAPTALPSAQLSLPSALAPAAAPPAAWRLSDPDGGEKGPASPSGASGQPARGSLGSALARVRRLLTDPFGRRTPPARPRTTLDDLSVGTPLVLVDGTEGIVLGVRVAEADVALRRGRGWKLKTMTAGSLAAVSTAGGADESAAREAAAELEYPIRRAALAAERSRAYREFLRRDLWSELRPALQEEIRRLRALPKDGRRAYLEALGDAIVGEIQAAHGSANLGFHYNLHGGQAEGYVEAGGIRVSQGDIALNYTMSGDPSFKVYFFQSERHRLYDVLDQKHPNLVSSRMGWVLNVFRLDHPSIREAQERGAASNPTAISMDFEPGKLRAMGRGSIGIPYEAYVAPPLGVFDGMRRKVGMGGLSRDEETLAVMRYLQAAARPR